MNNKIVIIGSIIIVLALASMVVLNFNDYLASTEADTGAISVGQNDSSYKVVFDQNTATQQITGIYSTIEVYVLISSNQPNKEFNISLKLDVIGASVVGVCNGQSSCIVASKIVSFSTPNATFGISANERRLPLAIPLVVSGNPIPAFVARQYSISVSSVNGGTYQYAYEGYAKGHFAIFISLALLVVGAIITGVGFVFGRSSSKGKPMRKRSWQEPTLGGSSSRFSSKMSFKSGKSSQKSNSNSTVRKVSTSVNCKKCGGVMPRNSQYCPHCYARQ